MTCRTFDLVGTINGREYTEHGEYVTAQDYWDLKLYSEAVDRLKLCLEEDLDKQRLKDLGEIDLTQKRLAHAENVIEQQNSLIASLLSALLAITNSGPDAIPIKEAFEMAHRAIERATGGKV
jgi:hypothetical protein